MAWTDQMVEDLRTMWKQGLTTAEIGKKLGVSKNSIVGKVHRLGLSGRPSPIKKKDGDEEHAADNKPALKDKAPRAEKESPKAVSEPAVKEEAKTAKPSVVPAEKNSEKKESRKEETKECFKSDLEKVQRPFL